MGGPANFTAVHMVWRWPLKRRGLRLQGGVEVVHRSRRVVAIVAVFGLEVPSVPLGVLVLEELGVLGLVRSLIGRGVEDVVKAMLALPSHSMMV